MKVFYSLIFYSLIFPIGAWAQNFYDSDSVQQIEIYFAQANWDEVLDTAKAGAGTYTLAAVRLNGTYYDSVGVKYKGNSSYTEAGNKNPFHIELNTFKNQTHFGYTDIKLSNGYGDPSLIREVLAYKVAQPYLTVPTCALAKVYVNDTYLGLYASAESINNGFVARNYFTDEGVFIKCNPIITPGPAVKSNLKYLGDDTAAYYNFYEMKSAKGWQDLISLCKNILVHDSLNSALNTEQALWMLAFNNLFVNLDSYTGAFAQNYYLYKDAHGRFNPILWDLNMAFGSFPFAGSPANGMGSLSVLNRVQFSPSYHATHADWPMIQSLLSNSTYQKRYYAHYKTLLYEMLEAAYLDSTASKLLAIAKPFALADTNKFFADTPFLQSLEQTLNFGSYQVPGVLALMRDRATYLKALPEFTVQAPIADSIYAIRVDPSLSTNKVFAIKVSGVAEVSVWVQTKRENQFLSYTLFDDGVHQDAAANDGIYAASIPLTSNQFNYYFLAENASAASYWPSRAPKGHFTFGQIPVSLPKGALVINEVLANNDKSDMNDYGIYTDWFELYNASDDTLNLFGTYVSDKRSNPFKYAFPAGTVLLPKGFIGVWADQLPDKNFLHANLNLSAEGESLYLFNKEALLLDELEFGLQTMDISLARCPDGTGNWVPMKPPTFMDSNNKFCVLGLTNVSQTKIQLYPNPCGDVLNLCIPITTLESLKIINTLGQTVLTLPILESKVEINLRELPAAVYFIYISSDYPTLKFIKTE